MLKKQIIWIVPFLSVLCLDQLSKALARSYLTEYDSVNVIGEYFVLILAQNTGAFLSLGSGLPEPYHTLFMLGIPVVLLFLGLVYLLKNPELPNLLQVAIALILSGGIGNIIDRFLVGSVTDFFFIDLGGWAKTGIFNIADMAIMAGLGIYIFQNFRTKKENHPVAADKNN
ncbi:MAG: signal peptidase II [Bacteroidia bacterium]|nr:signal peptidase II [Bacteroidia bacterium]